VLQGLEPNLLSSQPSAFQFNGKNGKVVGNLIIEEDILRFEGNADESATIFIELILKKFNKK